MALSEPIYRNAAWGFLESLPPADRAHCESVIWEDLAVDPHLHGQPDSEGGRHRLIKGWHFRYEVLNAAYFRITGIYYSPFNPRHPIFGQGVDLP